MFSSNTATVLNFQKTKTSSDDVFPKILYIHKKLKEIARQESLSKPKYKIASLTSSQIEKIKSMEKSMESFLVAYEYDKESNQCKKEILNRVHSLLDEYIDICKTKPVKTKNEEFKGFFEQ